MSKTYITGDTHRNFTRIHNFCTNEYTSTDDTLIILGDAGINFYLDESDYELKQMLSDYPITFFCVHGNHEERPYYIASYKEMTWHEGIVYYEETYPNILFAKDGEIYDFDGKKCIVIGGAYSIDKSYRLANHLPWFESEQASTEIKEYVESQLDKNHWIVDYVFSHTIPKFAEPTWSFKVKLDPALLDKSMEIWLDSLEEKLTYTRWFAGHYHVDSLSPDIRLMFEHIIELEAIDKVFHGKDEVYFMFNNTLLQGIIEVVDFYGTFYHAHEICYDILAPDENMLYKSIPNSSIVISPTNEQLHRLKQRQLGTMLYLLLQQTREPSDIVVNEDGWILAQDLLQHINTSKGWSITIEHLLELLTEPIQRYSFSDDMLHFRANPKPYVDYQFPNHGQPTVPPDILYYGNDVTSEMFICRRGLFSMSQESYCPLVTDSAIALDMGAAYGYPCVYQVYSKKMHEDGYHFYETDNGVWLIEVVPPEYISVKH